MSCLAYANLPSRGEIKVFANNGGGISIQESGGSCDDDQTVMINVQDVEWLCKAIRFIAKEIKESNRLAGEAL